MKDIMKEIINRFKSPVVWAGIISIVGLIFATAGVGLEDVTTWAGLQVVIVGVLSSPAKLAMIVVALFGFINNPKDKAGF